MKKTGITLALLTAVVSLMAQSPLPVVKNGFVVIAHRGNHVSVPENTLASLEQAIAAGADYAEIDLRTTKDGYLVLSHDGTVDRMTDGKGAVKDLTLEEIKKLTIKKSGTDHHAAYKVPEFKDVLKTCGGRLNIYLDFKDADVAETYRQIQAAGMERQIVVYLNKPGQYGAWKKIAPDMPLMTSVPDAVRTPEQLSLFLDQAKVTVLDNVQDAAMLAMARSRGVSVWLDVEAPDEGPVVWERTMRLGIQGVQTDHPQALTDYLSKNHWRNGMDATAAAQPKAGAATGYRKLADVPYDKSGNEQMLDAYLPQDVDNARVIVYLHGGGWTGGDKGEFPASLIEELVGKRKYILVSMNYRLVKDGRNTFPAQIEDIRSALAFLSRYADRYHYDGTQFALMGGSAGGHLAMLYAYGYDTAHQVRTVVDFWGPTDLADKAVRSDNKAADEKVVTLLGVADPGAAIARDASPWYRITKATGVPTILFHGGEDPLVHVSQAEKMYKKLQELGIPAQLEIYPHDKHGLGPSTAADAFGKTLTWLDKYYPSGATTPLPVAPASTTKMIMGASPSSSLTPSSGITPGSNATPGSRAGISAPVPLTPGETYAEKLGFPRGSKVIIFHVDDAGMSWYSNQGAIKSIDSGVATSTSIMMPCGWAASFAKIAMAKGYDAGLHLTLTSEWKDYRWPPLAGAQNTPGLVDKDWCLWPEVEDVVAHASADEVETEIRAQLARAQSMGLKPTHLDSHMGTLFATPGYLERYIKVGIENGIPVMFPGGNDKLLKEEMPSQLKDAAMVGSTIWAGGLPVLDDLLTISGKWTPAEKPVTAKTRAKYKVQKFKEALQRMQPGVAMFIVHSSDIAGSEDDFGHISASGASRFADMQAMMDPDLKAYIKSQGIILTTWRELMERRKKVK